MKLTFDYYCPHCKAEKTVEGSQDYYFEIGCVRCECGTVVSVGPKGDKFWDTIDKLKMGPEKN